MSTKDELQHRLVDLELELTRVRQEALDAQVTHERFASGVVARADAARQAELAAEDLEEHRRLCWYEHGVGQFMAPDRPPMNEDTELQEFCSKPKEQHLRDAPDGWPPGYDPSMFQNVPATNHKPADDRSGSVLGKLFAEQGVKL